MSPTSTPAIAGGLPVRQIAYFVADVRAAAADHARLFGSGPYFVADNIPVRRSLHRGVERPLDHSSAYGQWGPVMVEFVQQNNLDPSAFHDLYPVGSGRGGLHHVAIFVDDVAEDLARYAAAGLETALYAEMEGGFTFAMVDAVASLGHMIELYTPIASLSGFYGFVADAARGWDGIAPVRSMPTG